MALILRNTVGNPLGVYDAVDAVATAVKGGEVGTLVTVTYASGDLTAAGPATVAGVDGYIPGGTVRPAVSTVLPASIDGVLGLVDDGIAGYGTMFGSVLGATAGQRSYAPGSYGTVLGPHTATGSGKLTLWTNPGTYAVTLDAVDTTAITGLLPSNPTLTAGDALYAKVGTGLLSPNTSSVVQIGGGNGVVGRFINFENNGSMVTTPASLVGATPSYTQAVFNFNPRLA